MSKKKTLSEWVKESQEKHGLKYDYSKSEYKSAHSLIKIICPDHGEFFQRSNDHRLGKGCIKCSYDVRAKKTGNIKRKNIHHFIKNAQKIHGNQYDYSKSRYTLISNKIEIICKLHGSFWQVAHSHLEGSGCQRCSQNRISRKETIWLDLIGISDRQYIVRLGNKTVTVDGYDPSTNTCYEFYGDFWHGNPKIYNSNEIHPLINKTYGEIYNRTQQKEKLLQKYGYNVISLWESDFMASFQ